MSSTYSALRSSWREIRLLHLEASPDFSAPVACTSRTVSLFDKPNYTALSYCWGDRHETASIDFNGISGFSIPRNLAAALRRLRSSTEDVVLWADSISINQDPNKPEKNEQVALMRDIYSQASSTIIWLGEEADNSDLAVETILDLRAWWSRAWVIQELLLSPNPKVMCGSKSAPIEAFVHLDDLRRGYHRPSGRDIDNAEQPSRQLLKQNAFSQVLSHYFNDKRRVKAGVVNVEEWMVIVESFHATDSRDKVYGLLGLGTEADRRALPPNYSPTNTIANVYCRATAHFMMQRRDLLHLQFNANDVDRTLGLPSWCPDYSCDSRKVKERYVAFVVGMHEATKFFASGMHLNLRTQTSPSVQDLFPLSSHGNWQELHLRGWLVDEVMYAGVNPYEEPYTGSNITERSANIARRAAQTKANMLIWEAEARHRLETDNPYHPKTVDEVFWRVLMANSDFRWRPVPDVWKHYFIIWLDRAPLPPSAAELASTEAKRKRLYVKPFTDPAITRTHGRAFVITKKGYLGLAPRRTKVGDVVSVFKGGHVPFVVRKRDATGEENWKFVGESFVLGLMAGESIATSEERRFVLD